MQATATRAGDLIRDKLAVLRELDPASADETEALWPLTLERLDEPDDAVMVVGGMTIAAMRRALGRELDERIAEARDDSEVLT